MSANPRLLHGRWLGRVSAPGIAAAETTAPATTHSVRQVTALTSTIRNKARKLRLRGLCRQPRSGETCELSGWLQSTATHKHTAALPARILKPVRACTHLNCSCCVLRACFCCVARATRRPRLRGAQLRPCGHTRARQSIGHACALQPRKLHATQTNRRRRHRYY